MPDNSEPGMSLDMLIAAHQNAQAALNDTFVIDQAEVTVAMARQQDLLANQQTAARQVQVARAQLDDACQIGNQDKIATARQRLDMSLDESERVQNAIVAEMNQILSTRLDSAQQVFEQITRTLDTGQAIHSVRGQHDFDSAAESVVTAFRETLDECLQLVASLRQQ